MIPVDVISMFSAATRRGAIRRELERLGMAFEWLDAVKRSTGRRH